MKRMKYFVIIALLISVFLTGCSGGLLEQEGETITYNGNEYEFCWDCRHGNLVAAVDTSEYTKIGYVTSNIVNIVGLYAENTEHPDFLVTKSGSGLYFAKGKTPNWLEVEYVSFSITPSDTNSSHRYEISSALGPMLSPHSDANSSAGSGQNSFARVAQMHCYLRDIPNTYFDVCVLENGGTYYLCQIISDSDDGPARYAIKKDSPLHNMIFETLSGA